MNEPDIRHGDNIITGFEGEAGAKIELDDMILARNISTDLHNHYPAHLWLVNVNSLQGVAVIKNARISLTHGFLMKLRDITPYDTGASAKVMRAGGELLERAYMKRGRSNGEFANKVDGQSPKKRLIT